MADEISEKITFKNFEYEVLKFWNVEQVAKVSNGEKNFILKVKFSDSGDILKKEYDNHCNIYNLIQEGKLHLKTPKPIDYDVIDNKHEQFNILKEFYGNKTTGFIKRNIITATYIELFLMEYIHSKTLLDKCTEGETGIEAQKHNLREWNTNGCHNIMKQFCESGNSLHKNNYLHKDLHDNNVLIDSDNNVYIIDWATLEETLPGNATFKCYENSEHCEDAIDWSRDPDIKNDSIMLKACPTINLTEEDIDEFYKSDCDKDLSTVDRAITNRDSDTGDAVGFGGAGGASDTGGFDGASDTGRDRVTKLAENKYYLKYIKYKKKYLILKHKL